MPRWAGIFFGVARSLTRRRPRWPFRSLWSTMTSSTRPAPFSAFTTSEFWGDPHISARKFANHLDPDNPMASRPHEFIDRSVEWLIPVLHLQPGARLLDLGCGPGFSAPPSASNPATSWLTGRLEPRTRARSRVSLFGASWLPRRHADRVGSECPSCHGRAFRQAQSTG